jgi:cytochrome P450
MPLPAGPRAHSLVQFARWFRDPLGFLDGVAAEYGGIFTVRFPSYGDMVLISEPAALKTFFSNPAIAAPGDTDLASLLGDNSLLLLSGEKHLQERRMLMPPFHGKRMHAAGAAIQDLAREVIARWRPGQRVAVRDAMQEITINVMLQIVFGSHTQEQRQRLRVGIGRRMALSASLAGSLPLWFPVLRVNWGPWKRIQEMQQACDALFYGEIERARRAPDPGRTDVLSMLAGAVDDAGNPIPDAQIRDELMTLIVAGHENVASSLAWAVYWVHRYPRVRERLREELGALGPDPDPLAIGQLPYLNAVCNETLRIYPPAMLTLRRVVQSPIEILGNRLEPGTRLWGSIYLVHRRPELYPEPKRFRPERFLERDFSPYEFLPFGGGIRRCIGAAFAMFQMKLTLATVLLNADLGLLIARDLRAVRRTGLLAPEKGFEMLVERTAPKALRSKAA